MKRSWRLTVGFFWKTLGVIVLIGLIVYAVTQIITTPIALIGGFVSRPRQPDRPGARRHRTRPSAQVFLSAARHQRRSRTVVTAVIGAVMAVVQSSAVALIYLDLRMRKEGLDLHLIRFVEARQAGATGLPDPYQPAEHPAAAAYRPIPPAPDACRRPSRWTPTHRRRTTGSSRSLRNPSTRRRSRPGSTWPPRRCRTGSRPCSRPGAAASAACSSIVIVVLAVRAARRRVRRLRSPAHQPAEPARDRRPLRRGGHEGCGDAPAFGRACRASR